MPRPTTAPRRRATRTPTPRPTRATRRRLRRRSSTPRARGANEAGAAALHRCSSSARPWSPESCSRRSSTGEAMHTQETEREPPGLGKTAKTVTEHASALVRLELELAALELKRKASSLAIGIGLGLTAAVLLLYALGFGLATVAAGIATATSTWLALL